MREIKFRVWANEYKHMVDVNVIDFKNKMVYGKNNIDYDFNKIKLMQYTGLKDMNGVEIYEGDILEYKYLYDRRYITKGIVTMNSDKATFSIKDLKGITTEEIELYRLSANNYFSVIGNIYENKELLK